MVKSFIACVLMVIGITGCTMLVGTNYVQSMKPGMAYRTVDVSGSGATAVQDSNGGGKFDAELSAIP